MEKLLSMLRDMELNSQEKFLKDLKETGEEVGAFIPAMNGEMLFEGIEKIDQLFKQGIKISFICLMDDIADMFREIDLNVPILSLSQVGALDKKPFKVIMLRSMHYWPDALYQYFEQHGMRAYLLWNTEELEQYKRYFWSNILNIYAAYQDYEDDISRESFLGSVKAKFTGQYYDRFYATEAQYLVQGFTPPAGGIAIDGGAFDGETAKMFKELGAEVYAFELDKDNFQKVKAAAEKFDFHAMNMGLWSCKKQDKYFPGGEASTVMAEGTEAVSLIDIDTFVRENDLPRVDYIKLDVEGAEMEVLKGAVMTISKWKPVLAISAYHQEEDLWTLGRYIKSIRPDYKFEFRHHKIDARDYYLDDRIRNMFIGYGLDLMVPTPWEAVLYAR